MSEEVENGKRSTTIKYPDEVVDKKAYLEYVNLTQSPEINDEGKFYLTSDGIQLNLLSAWPVLLKKCEHLPESEIKEIKEGYALRRSIISKCNFVKRNAFGLKPIASKVVVPFLDKLLNEKTAELLELFGKFYSAKEIHHIVLSEWGYEGITITAIRDFYNRNKETIRDKQEIFKNDFSDLRLGFKRSRLDELHYHYNDRNSIYGTSKNREDQKLVLAIIEQIRKEVEGDRVTLDAKIEMDVNHTIALHVQKDLMNELSITSLIISNMCGKLNIDPKYLLSKLHSSYYSKFNSFIAEPDYAEEIIYPSEQPYDFEQIKKKNAQLEQTPVLALNKSLERTEEKKADKVKEMLKNALNKKKATLKVIEDRMAGYSGGEEEKTQISYDPEAPIEEKRGWKMGKGRKKDEEK